MRTPPRHEPNIDIDDESTWRLVVQKCPRCGELTAVPLGFETSPCEVCGERIRVAPLLA